MAEEEFQSYPGMMVLRMLFQVRFIVTERNVLEVLSRELERGFIEEWYESNKGIEYVVRQNKTEIRTAKKIVHYHLLTRMMLILRKTLPRDECILSLKFLLVLYGTCFSRPDWEESQLVLNRWSSNYWIEEIINACYELLSSNLEDFVEPCYLICESYRLIMEYHPVMLASFKPNQIKSLYAWSFLILEKFTKHIRFQLENADTLEHKIRIVQAFCDTISVLQEFYHHSIESFNSKQGKLYSQIQSMDILFNALVSEFGIEMSTIDYTPGTTRRGLASLRHTYLSKDISTVDVVYHDIRNEVGDL
eukprot:CAMPEP_0117418354 /NCGR_PEP_ID=MMETSP0758-20121206/153_1 /TAXON_ID=63605 /ORGANISM="Percolomonas cosmopolitus, Strain AE-1 (ATCC 50343)" /LENGTH=304 /DNA_ID=CAMNT_0005198809 /DNA_START=2072 /DNA_END=2983 /DNA_ORIENTATION=+